MRPTKHGVPHNVLPGISAEEEKWREGGGDAELQRLPRWAACRRPPAPWTRR